MRNTHALEEKNLPVDLGRSTPCALRMRGRKDPAMNGGTLSLYIIDPGKLRR